MPLTLEDNPFFMYPWIEISATTPMLTGESLLGEELHSGFEKVSKIDTGIKDNLIIRLMEMKGIRRRSELVEALSNSVSFQAVDQWYKSPHTTTSSLRKIFTQWEFQLNWMPMQMDIPCIFPHFNLITKTYGNAQEWFGWFSSEMKRLKQEHDYSTFHITVISILESIDKLVKWDLPDLTQDHIEKKNFIPVEFFEFFFDYVNYSKPPTERREISSFINRALITSCARTFDDFDNLNSQLTANQVFNFSKLVNLMDKEKVFTDYEIKLDFKVFYEYVLENNKSMQISTKPLNKISVNANILSKLATIENKLDQVLEAISILNKKKSDNE